MDANNRTGEETEDFDFLSDIAEKIEKAISDLKKAVNNINQMRVEAAYLQSDLLTTIEASTWQDIAGLIGLTSTEPDIDLKYE